MRFEVRRLELEGFCTYIKPAVIRFDALGPGLHYLKGENEEEPDLGSNGAGKSSIWDAVCWCLTGSTTDGRHGPDVRPWDGYKGPTVVLIRALIGDDLHTIFRQQSPNCLELDGKECSQDQLDSLIGQSLEFLTHTMIMGQGVPLFFNRSPREKMALFSEVLGLERWDRMSDHARDKLTERQVRLDQLLADIAGYDNQLQMLKTLVTGVKAKSNQWQEQRDGQVAELERSIKAVERQQTENQKRLDAATLAADSAGTEAKALMKEIDERRADLASARHFYNKHEARLELLHQSYKGLKEDLVAGYCPTCKQPLKNVTAKHRAAIKDKMAQVKAELDKGIPHELTAKVSLAQKMLEVTIARRDKFLEQEDLHRTTINRCAPIAAECRTRISMLKRDIAQLEDGNNPYRSELSALRKQRERLAADREAAQDRKKKLTALIARTKFWVKGFKEIRLYVIEDVLKQLELESNAILQEVGLHKWKIRYAIERETKSGKVRAGLDVLIQSPKNKKAVKFQCWSGGEGRRLLIVGSLALSKVLLDYVGIETNLEVLDEPTQYIGENGIEDIIDFLADRARRLKRTIVYVDHGARESARFASTILVTKDDTGSHIRVSNT